MLFGEPTKVAPDPVLAPDPELDEARGRLYEELDRADAAIQAAMDHADEIFLRPTVYRGPERRSRPRPA